MSRFLCCLVVLLLGLMACVAGAAVRTDTSKGDALAKQFLRMLIEDAKNAAPHQPANNQTERGVDAKLSGAHAQTGSSGTATVHQPKRVWPAKVAAWAGTAAINTGMSVYQVSRAASPAWGARKWKRDFGYTPKYISGALQDTGNWVSGAATDTGNWVSGAATDTGNWVSGAATDTGNWVSGAATDTGNWVSGAATDTGNFVSGALPWNWKRELGQHGYAKVEVTNFSKYPLATRRISDRDGSHPSSKLPAVIKPAFEEAGLVGRESSAVLTVINPEREVDIMVLWSLSEGGELSMATGTYAGSERKPNNQYADWNQLLDDPSFCHGDAACTTQSARLVTLEHCGEQGMCVYIMGSVNAEGNPVIRLNVVPKNLENMAEGVREEVQDMYG